VPANVLGARVHDNVGAPCERVLQTWWAEGAVDGKKGAAGVGAFGVFGNLEGFAGGIDGGGRRRRDPLRPRRSRQRASPLF
jgi:hypothetical protein